MFLPIETSKNIKKVYFGIRIFFARIAFIVQAVVFTLIHISTGFDPALQTQTDLALLGLRLQMALIPMLFLFLQSVLMKEHEEHRRRVYNQIHTLLGSVLDVHASRLLATSPHNAF